MRIYNVCMRNVDVVYSILNDIFLKDMRFNVALKNNYINLKVERTARASISALVGCELRHHLLFVELINNVEPFDINTHLPVCIYLANHLFYKRFDENELNILVKTNNLLEFTNKVTASIENDNLVPTRLVSGSPEYLSVRYNTPLWITKMWTKHFGRGLSYKILQANYKPTITHVRVNTLLTGREEINSDEEFHSTNVEDIFVYQGNGPLKHNEKYSNNLLFLERPVYKIIYESLEIEPYQRIALLSGFTNPMYLEILMHKHEYKLEMIASDYQHYCDAKKILNLFSIDNVNIYSASGEAIDSCLSNDVDYFFVLPRNSNLELLKDTPDYFTHFKQNELDSIINDERVALEEAANRTSDGGTIIYMVPTLNKRESLSVVKDFLLHHPTYSLVYEKQYFPFEEYNTSLYVAKILKMERKDD